MREEEEKRRKEKKRKEKGKVSSNSEIPSRTNQLSLSLPLSSIRIQFTPSRLHLKSQSIFLSFHHLLPDCRHHLLFSHPIPNLPVARQKMKKKKEVPYHSPSLEKTSPEVVVNILSMITWR